MQKYIKLKAMPSVEKYYSSNLLKQKYKYKLTFCFSIYLQSYGLKW